MCIRIYVFNLKKQIRKKKQEYKKTKETKEEKIKSIKPAFLETRVFFWPKVKNYATRMENKKLPVKIIYH